MTKISIVTDTTMGLTFEEAEEYNIHLISNGLSVAGTNYNEYIDMDTDSFLEIDSQSDSVPKTGAAAPGVTMEVMLKAAKESNDVLCLAMTSGYSGGINIRSMVAKQLNEDYDTNIIVYDTPNIFSGAIPYYREAVRLRNQGKSLEEVIKALDELAEHTNSHYAAEPYYITEGGRFKETLEELQIEKGDGQYVGVEIHDDPQLLWKAKNSDEAIEKLFLDLEKAVEKAQDDNIKLSVIVVGNTNNEHEKLLLEKIKEKYPDMKTEYNRMGPIASIHVGHGAIGLIWSPER
ncbi:MAG: DegV family protein [Atopococcus tabaci]|uniref:DegV family protein n=1 Tax=Atopococcus tabaci TaxID=269774 RepID=A0AA43UAU6_9LACT|nr:DegV family protein [Atopococcus tabaci]